ncbi:hypothetical protein N665_0116s0078 [Sinapis alba]|nr:hypothetical protein N665_0116s0078 [Sinapis alba]
MIRLNASNDVCRYLLRQRLPFRRHDESMESANMENFVELVKYTAGKMSLISILLNVIGASCKRKYMIREDQLLEYVESEWSNNIKICQTNGLLKYFHTVMWKKNLFDRKKPRKRSNITNLHYYQIVYFYTVLDMQIKEFNGRFDEINIELLGCTASLSPIDSFHQYFSSVEHISLEHQLGIHIDNISEDQTFANLESLWDLARVMLEIKNHLSHPLVYQLFKLVLTLPVATTYVERSFSVMKILKLP